MSKDFGKIVREDWANTVRDNRQIQQDWDDSIPSGFVDAPIKENLTGKAKRPEYTPKPKGSSLG